MIKSIVVHQIPMSHVAAMERWYYRDHAPEINRRFLVPGCSATRVIFPWMLRLMPAITAFITGGNLFRILIKFWKAI